MLLEYNLQFPSQEFNFIQFGKQERLLGNSPKKVGIFHDEHRDSLCALKAGKAAEKIFFLDSLLSKLTDLGHNLKGKKKEEKKKGEVKEERS